MKELLECKTQKNKTAVGHVTEKGFPHPTASLHGNCQPLPTNSYLDCVTYPCRTLTEGILVELLVTMVSVSAIILVVLQPHVCVHVRTLMCVLRLSACCPLLLVEAKTCLRSDSCTLCDENEIVILTPVKGLWLLIRSAENFLQIN